MYNKKTAPKQDFSEPTFDLYLDHVMDRVDPCPDHRNSEWDWYCYNVEGLTGNRILGVCNKRALMAGMNGRINPSSLVKTSVTRTKYGQ